MKLDRHFGDLNITTAFTWGRGMDYQQGDDGALMWQINVRRNYARTDWDRTITYSQSYVYQLPAGHGKRWVNSGPAAYVLGNWQLSGVLSMMTGQPFTLTASGSSLNTPIGEQQTANQVNSVEILHGINTGNQWFSTSSFAQPTGGGGGKGRQYHERPGLYALNLALSKSINSASG